MNFIHHCLSLQISDLPNPFESEQAKKRPHEVAFLIILVEARGFEPLSEDNETQASTGVVTVLMSPERSPRNRLRFRSAWLSSSAHPRRRCDSVSH